MENIKCPKCGNSQRGTAPMKKWAYSNIQVTRFRCKCGQLFNFYKGKTKTWTIPKSSLAPES